MDVIISNSLSVQDSWEVQTSLKNSETISDFTEIERNKQDLLPGAVWEVLDFWHITSPKYIKLTATESVNVSFWGGSVMNNVSIIEIKWEIGTITVDNTSTTEVSKLDFIVME